MKIVYKDAIEWEFRNKDILYEREREFKIPYKNIILTHKFTADFVVLENIVLEVKALEGGFNDDFIAQVLNYLKSIGM